MAIMTRQDLYIVPAVQDFALVTNPIVFRPTIAVDDVLVPDDKILNYNATAFGVSDAWYWFGPPAGTADGDLSFAQRKIQRGAGTLAIGAVVTVVYFGDGSAVSSPGTPLTPTIPTGTTPPLGESFGTCGSGIFEAVEEVNDVSSLAELQQISDGLLERSGTPARLISFETDKPGLEPGMLIPINLPANNVVGDYLITSISSQDSEGKALAFGSVFRHTVKCSRVAALGDWVTWFERLISRTKKGKPVQLITPVTFVLAPGASLTGGLAITNAYPIRADGQLIDFVLQAETPPLAEILFVDVEYYAPNPDNSGSFLDPVSIFPGSKPFIPASGNKLYTYTEFATTPFLVKKDGLLKVNVRYQIIGLGFAPAESCTGVLRIQN